MSQELPRSTEVTPVDLMLAIKGLQGEVKGLRTLMTTHVEDTRPQYTDHEMRIRSAESSIQAGKGVIGFLGAVIAAFAAVGTYLAQFIERS